MSPVNHTRAEDNSEEVLIHEYAEDVTGSGVKDTIQLYGVLLSSDSAYYRDIYAVIETKDQQTWTINYQGGYEPQLYFMDITQNGINDILFQSEDIHDDGSSHSDLHTIHHNQVKQQTLPTLTMTGEFGDNFQATFNITPNEAPVTLDLKNRANKYIQSGIFNDQGKLLKEITLNTQHISSIEPLYISQSKGYGLKTLQTLLGADDNDELGKIETLWYYENNNWIILQQDLRQASDINTK